MSPGSGLGSEVLGPLARDILVGFFGEDLAREHYALAGGTGLALGHLQHRVSVDLDLFTSSEAAFRAGTRLIENAAAAHEATAIQARTAQAYVEYRVERAGDLLKVDVVYEPPALLQKPIAMDDVRIRSLLDLGVDKVGAIYSRGGAGGEPKDYADLHCILAMTPLTMEDLLRETPHKFVDFDDRLFAALLVEARSLSYTAWRWLKPVRDSDIRDRLVGEADRIFARYRPRDE